MAGRLSVLFFATLVGLSCAGSSVRKSSDLRDFVLNEPMSTTRLDALFALTKTLDLEETLWLIEQLTHTDPWVRSKAAMALSDSKSPGAASALYLASLGEKDAFVYGCVLGSLGRMRQDGKALLVRLLERRGPSPILLAALAQSSRVKPKKTWRGGGYFVNDLQGQEWWQTTGRRELGDQVPDESKEAHPEGL